MSIWYDDALVLSVSPDGIHWTELGTTGHAGDRSTFFYNPFRRVWVFSLRGNQYPGGGHQQPVRGATGNRPSLAPPGRGMDTSRCRG